MQRNYIKIEPTNERTSVVSRMALDAREGTVNRRGRKIYLRERRGWLGQRALRTGYSTSALNIQRPIEGVLANTARGENTYLEHVPTKMFLLPENRTTYRNRPLR